MRIFRLIVNAVRLAGLAGILFLSNKASAQTGQPGGSPGTPVKIPTGIPVPSGPEYNFVRPFVNEQAILIPDLYCVSSQDSFWMFETDSSPIEGALIPAEIFGGGLDGVWTPLIVEEANWLDLYIAGQIDQAKLLDFINTGTRGAIMLGQFEGSCDTLYILAWGMVRDDDNGMPQNYLIPIKEAPQEASAVLPLVGNPALLIDWETCDTCDDGCCDANYRWNLSRNLKDFVKCAANSSPPIWWPNLACFVGCVPFAAGGPAYLACAAACNGVVALNTVVDVSQCANDLDNANDSDLANYCACRNFQDKFCPGGAEDDLHGCP